MTDQLAAALASYALETDPKGQENEDAAKRCLLDAFAVALGATHHPAARAARRYGYTQGAREGALIWSTTVRATPEAATLCNGVLLRCYDYNDLYFGTQQWAHPGDVVSALVTVADWRHAPGQALLESVSVAYDVSLELCDTFSLASRGWDYVNLVAIGAACGTGRLMGLSQGQLEQALAITVLPHIAADQTESGDLNEAGNLTMWKRFNAADAVRHAVYACSLAEAGAEGPLKPFYGEMGLLAMLGLEDADDERLRSRLSTGRALNRAGDSEFKSWPVGSRAQSAVLAALRVRERLEHPWQIDHVIVHADQAAFDHLVRADAFAPRSREMADHSLPYIVTAALFDGGVDTSSFGEDKVADPVRREFLSKRVTVEPDPRLSEGHQGGFPVRLEVVTLDGERLVEEAGTPPGHRDNSLSLSDLAKKLHQNADQVIGTEAAERLIGCVRTVTEMEDSRVLTSVMVA